MKRNFLHSTGRVALVAAFLLGLFLPAGIRGEENGKVWLRIMAFTDAPVVGANVRITLGGPHGPVLADAKAATNDQGVFPARIWRPWLLDEEAAADKKAPEPERRRRQSFVRISISGGTINGDPFLGHLSADVALTDPAHQILVVNPVTTLVSRVLDELPELKLNKAEALVRRFLKLPANYSLGLALRQGPHYVSPFFSPAGFMAEARDAGGLDAFEHLLLRELLDELLASPSATHAFRPPQLLGTTGSSDAAQPLGSTAATSPATSVIQAGLYAGLLDFANAAGVENLAGWALSQTGLFPTPNTTQADIEALTGALNDLQSSIENLTTGLNQLTQLLKSASTEELYATIVTPAQTLANQVNGVEGDLAYFASACPPQYIGQILPNPEPYCTNQKAYVNGEMDNLTIQQAYVTIEGYVQDNPTLGTEGMLHLFSLWLGQSRQFFRPADSAKMQNLYDYWDAALTQAANLKIEALHENDAQDGNPKELTDFMGNPDATPPTTGTFQSNQAANQKLMFPPVPIDPVTRSTAVISTQDPNHTMWALLPWAPAGPGFASPQPSCATWPSPSLGVLNVLDAATQPYLGFNNWAKSPSKAQWQAAVSLAPTNGSVQWSDWLVQQTQTSDDETPPSIGFFVWAIHCSGGAWTSTYDHSVNLSQFYWYMNPTSNTFSTAVSSSAGNGLNYSGGTPFFDFPVRTLAAGEQYFWYQ